MLPASSHRPPSRRVRVLGVASLHDNPLALLIPLGDGTRNHCLEGMLLNLGVNGLRLSTTTLRDARIPPSRGSITLKHPGHAKSPRRETGRGVAHCLSRDALEDALR